MRALRRNRRMYIPPGQLGFAVTLQVRVEGHADAVPLGAACSQRFSSNLDLSAKRAVSVAEYLKTRGVPSKRLMATGLGSEWPIAAGFTASALAQNRRIEFKLDAR